MLKAIAKALVDPRRHQGRDEFRFRPRRLSRDAIVVDVTARDKSFQAPVHLRRGTSDPLVFEQVFVDNEYNMRRFKRWPEIVARYEALSGEGTPLILDLGANIGLTSLYFAKNWPRAQILSVEPSEANYAQLLKNVSRFDRIHTIFGAVARRDGFVRIADPASEEWAYRTELSEAGAAESLPAFSVQSLLDKAADIARPRPFIAKIDIEGFEQDLFSGDTDWVDQFPVIVIELHDWHFPRQATATPFLRTISQRNRDFVFFRQSVYSIANDG